MNKLHLLAAAAVTSLALTACGGVQATQTSSAPAGNNQGTPAAVSTSVAPSDPVEPTGSPAAEPGDVTSEPTEQDQVAAFGEAFTWEDGLSVTIAKPKPYTPSEWAAGTGGFKKFVSFEIRVVNKTGKAWDPVGFSTSVQSNNEEASEVFDSGKLKDSPQTKLLNGREAKFTVAYGVGNPADLVMEVNPDFEHTSVLFQQ